MIYFIINRQTRAVKIGTSSDPEGRLKSLQTASPDLLELLGVIEGGVAEEKALHVRFKEYHRRGEWFEASEVFLEFISQILGSPIIAARSLAVPVGLRSEFETNAWSALVHLLTQHGVEALSIRGPIGESIDDVVKNLAYWLNRAGDSESMRRVYDAVTETAERMFGSEAAVDVSYCLDHRFDGVGGWYA